MNGYLLEKGDRIIFHAWPESPLEIIEPAYDIEIQVPNRKYYFFKQTRLDTTWGWLSAKYLSINENGVLFFEGVETGFGSNEYMVNRRKKETELFEGLQKEKDAVTHPSHYNKGIECWDYTTSHNMGFLDGNVVKYVTRFRHKNGLEDLKKCKEYLDKLIQVEKEKLV